MKREIAVRSRVALRSILPTLGGVGLALGLLSACSDQPGNSASDEGGHFDQLDQAVIQSKALSITLPVAADIGQLAVGASGTVTLADRVKVEGLTAAAAPTTGRVQVNNDANLQSIVSDGSVALGARTKVTGNVLAGGAVTRPASVTVTGTVTQNASLAAPKTVSWNYSADSVSLGNVAVNAGHTRDLAPGTYGSLTLSSQATVTLHTGVYVFSSISIQAASKVLVDSASGPVQVYSPGAFGFQGAISGASAATGTPQLLIGLAGTGTFTVLSSFTGVLLAPNGTLNVSSAPTAHHATFYGKNVTLQPDTNVKLLPFNWAALVPPPPASTSTSPVPTTSAVPVPTTSAVPVPTTSAVPVPTTSAVPPQLPFLG